MDKLTLLKRQMEDIIAKAKAEARDLSAEDAEAFDAAKAEFDGLKAAAERTKKSLAALEALSLPEAPEAPEAAAKAKSLGDAFVKSGAFAGFVKANPSGVSDGTPIHVGKVATGIKATELLQGPAVTETTITTKRDATPTSNFLDLITMGETNSNVLEYLALSVADNTSAIETYGALKPETYLDSVEKTATAKTFANGVTVANQTMADAPFLQSYLNEQLRKYILQKLEQQIIAGTGLNGEAEGILNTSGTLAIPVYEPGTIGLIAQALEALEGSNVVPNAIVMNPADAWHLQMQKDGQGNYAMGNLLASGGAALAPFGVPLRKSVFVPRGTILVGDFSVVTYLQRDGVTVEAFNQHKDYAQRNLVYVRGETRGIVANFQPSSIAVITF